MITAKHLENWVKTILYAVLLVTPLLAFSSLYFPYTTSKAYALRVLVELGFIGWVPLLLIRKEIRSLLKNPIVWGILIFLLALVVTAFSGVDSVHSLFNRLERSDGVLQFGFWALFFLMAVSVFRTHKDWGIALLLYVTTALTSVIIGIFQGQAVMRLPGTFGNSSFEGVFLFFAIGFAALFFTERFSFLRNIFGRKSVVWVGGGTIVLFVIAIILTQTRGLYLGLIAGFITFTALANFFLRDRLRVLIRALNTLLIVLVIFFALIFSFPDSSLVTKYGIVRRVAQAPRTESVTERLIEWKIALKGFVEKPLAGWGSENFIVVSNKYYDYRVGLIDQWFDRPHNQFLQILSEGGILLFGTYVFLLWVVFSRLVKIFKKERLVGAIATATFAGYLVQNAFLFDMFASYIGLLTLLGFLCFEEQSRDSLNNAEKRVLAGREYALAGLLAVIMFFAVWQTAVIPYKANILIKRYIDLVGDGKYAEAHTTFKESLKFSSPYVFADVRKYAGWELLVKGLKEEVPPENRAVIAGLYEDVMPELEKVLAKHPADPQTYYVLGALYRLGYERLGRTQDIANAERVMRQALQYSDMRVEYVDEMGQVFILQKKFDELNALMERFLSRVGDNDPYRFLTLGHTYFLQDEFDRALAEYDKARVLGAKFWDNDRDYYRYLEAAQATNQYEKAAALIEGYLANKEKDADNYFNLAVAYFKLGERDKAKETYLQAAALDDKYRGRQYEDVFLQ